MMMMPSIFGENLFDDFWDFPLEREFFGKGNRQNRKTTEHLMRTDVKETDENYELEVDLPGFKKEDVQVKLENGYLTIQAAKSQDQDEKDKNGKYIRRERYAGSCSRSFYVGENVTQDQIHGRFEDGILRLTIPKEDPKKIEESKYISIEG